MKIKATRVHTGMLGSTVALLVVACGSDTLTAASQVHARRNSDSFSVGELLRPASPIGELIISDLVAANTRMGSTHIASLHFSASSAADYAEVQTCINSACDPMGNTVINYFNLPPLPEGKVVAQVRACMLQQRVLPGQPNCGEWAYTEFSSPEAPDADTNAALDAKAAKEAELFGLVQELKSTLERFQIESERCVKAAKSNERVYAMRGLVSAYLALGEAYIEASLKPKDASLPEEPGMAGGTPVARVAAPISEHSKRLAKFKKYDGAVRTFAKARGLFEEAKPIPAVQTLGLAVFDMFQASAEVGTKCLAEAQASVEISAIKLRLEEVQTRLQSIDNFLKEGTGL